MRVAGFMKSMTGFITEAEKMYREPLKASEQKKQTKTRKNYLVVTMVWRWIYKKGLKRSVNFYIGLQDLLSSSITNIL